MSLSTPTITKFNMRKQENPRCYHSIAVDVSLWPKFANTNSGARYPRMAANVIEPAALTKQLLACCIGKAMKNPKSARYGTRDWSSRIL